MPFDNAAKQVGLQAIANNVTVVAIHGGDPGTGASNETSNTRLSASFSAPSGDEIVTNTDLNFSGAPNAGATWFTVWAGSTRYGKGQITGDTTFNGDGDFRLLAGTRLRIIN